MFKKKAFSLQPPPSCCICLRSKREVQRFHPHLNSGLGDGVCEECLQGLCQNPGENGATCPLCRKPIEQSNCFGTLDGPLPVFSTAPASSDVPRPARQNVPTPAPTPDRRAHFQVAFCELSRSIETRSCQHVGFRVSGSLCSLSGFAHLQHFVRRFDHSTGPV